MDGRTETEFSYGGASGAIPDEKELIWSMMAEAASAMASCILRR